MKIRDILQNKDRIFSFEFFPPKTETGEKNLFAAIEELKALSPDFVSVTYGALGNTQEKSLDIIRRIHEEIGLEVMAHYTCIGATQEKVNSFLAEVKEIGLDNILALRGDAPLGTDIADALRASSFKYACDLVDFIKTGGHDFSIGVAGYPEGHPESPSFQDDLDFLRQKIDAGADFIITQLFFDNEDFYRFRDRLEHLGIHVPVIPGIMPIQNFKQIQKMTSLCGTHIPQELRSIFTDEGKSDEDKKKYGLDFTTKQCRDLLENGARGLHFYSLNRSSATKEIFTRLSAG